LSDTKVKKSKKKKYSPPQLKKEKMMAFGALCNGTSNGGRKTSAGAPDFCQASKLLS
jgi:hypothetical protein